MPILSQKGKRAIQNTPCHYCESNTCDKCVIKFLLWQAKKEKRREHRTGRRKQNG